MSTIRHLSLIALALVLFNVWTHADEVEVSDSVESEQYGKTRLDFTINGARGFVVIPTAESKSEDSPWIWYAPTFIGKYPNNGHAWMFNQFLAGGFYICGIDVGESYGSPEGTGLYEAFHDYIVGEYGLSEKATLIPQSRGGLMLYNWAVEHPESVACVAGIYTVCNIASYPGLERAAPAYKMSAEELERTLGLHNPIDRVKALADAKMPIFHIHGDSDSVVPIEANAGLLVERYRELGGDAVLKIIPGKGHEECDEFFKDQKFVDFALEHGSASAQ